MSVSVLYYCDVVLFRLVLCQLIDARSVLEIKSEFYASWKCMAQVLMSTFECRYRAHLMSCLLAGKVYGFDFIFDLDFKK